MAIVLRISLVILWLLHVAAGQDDVFLERPVRQEVDLDASARLNCTANDDTAVISLQWLRYDSVVSLSGRVRVDQGSLVFSAVTWSDIGVYTCVLTLSDGVYSASATLNITGYVKPFVEGAVGVSNLPHELGEEQKIECPIGGYPGPESFYWQYSESGDNVTSDTEGSGVFVDGEGRLDVSGVEEAGRVLFECVGVDAAGNSARTLIRINTVDPEEDDEEEGLDLLEWYFILAYSVAGALVLAGVTVSVFACWLHRDQCWERVEQRKSTRMRVRRSKVNLEDMQVQA